MKKIIPCLLAFLLLLTGCSAGISQADYDAMVAERDEALAQIEILNKKLEALGQYNNSENNAAETKPTEAKPTETIPPEENIADLLEIETVKWHKHYINADNYHCDLLVTNNSHQLVTAKFAIKYYDASNNVIGIGNVSTEALNPGATHFLSSNNESPYEYAEVSITSAKVDDRYQGGMENVECSDYAVNGEKVIFEVKNNGDAAVSFVKGIVLFYNGNEVVDYDSAYAVDDDSELKPGATLMAEVTTNKTFTSYRIFYYGRIN